MVITTLASLTASEGEAATAAPASASGAVASGDRSHTVVLSPAATRLRDIAEPMMPGPRTAAAIPSLGPFMARPPPRWPALLMVSGLVPVSAMAGRGRRLGRQPG